MKRDMDLVRDLVLYIEADETWPKSIQNIEIEGYGNDGIQYHLFLMQEAGLIQGCDVSTRGHHNMAVLRLTWEGHEFATNARNPSNWDKLKRALGDLGDISFDIAKTCLASIVGAGAGVAMTSYLTTK